MPRYSLFEFVYVMRNEQPNRYIVPLPDGVHLEWQFQIATKIQITE